MVRILILPALLLASACPSWAETWTDSKGRSIEAEALDHDFENDMVEFALPTGRKVKMKISLLSETSQDRLREIEVERQARWQKLEPGKVVSFTPKNAGVAQFTYHCYVPSSFKPDKRTPILLAFSAGGKGKGIMSHFKEAAEAKGWLVVGFDKLKNKMTWSPAERDKAHGLLLADVSGNIPHHPYRMYMGGMSGGAMRAYEVALAYPEKPFAGIIALGGWMGRAYLDKNITTHMAVAIVNGDNDRGANAYVARNTEFLEGFKARVKRFTFTGGHTLPPKPMTLEVFGWLEEDWKAVGMREQVKKMKAGR